MEAGLFLSRAVSLGKAVFALTVRLFLLFFSCKSAYLSKNTSPFVGSISDSAPLSTFRMFLAKQQLPSISQDVYGASSLFHLSYEANVAKK